MMFKQFLWIFFLSAFLGCSQPSGTFNQIGVVEGFYGNPWSHQARLDLVRFMGEVGMNVYYYAPKDDPFHRSKWREPYEGEKLDEFRELLEVSNASGVDLYFAISPGLDIIYSDSSDFAALENKLENMTELGVEHIALFLDDVPQELQHEQDKENYASLADAHIDIINKLWRQLKQENIKLVVCPTTYTSAWGSREYIEKLGQQVPKEIPLSWTGEDVAISNITRKETESWASLMNRDPLIWDNFPVNDFEVWRPILGPLRGRESSLAKTAEGIIANPMDLPYASMIPLYTVAEYGNNPENYEADKALKEAVMFLAGEEAFYHMMPVVEIYSDYGWTDNVFTPVYTPGKPLKEELLYEKLDTLEFHLNSLTDSSFVNNKYVQNFVREIQPFVKKTRNDLDNLLSKDRSQIDIEPGYSVDWGTAILSINREGDKLTAELELDEVKPNHEWIVVITEEEQPQKTWLQPEDLIIRWKLNNSDSARADHFHLTPFSQRGISDIKIRTITSFFEHFTKSSETAITSQKESLNGKTRYRVTFPAPEKEKVRFNVFLNPGGYMLSKEPYLGNPHTYPVLSIKQKE